MSGIKVPSVVHYKDPILVGLHIASLIFLLQSSCDVSITCKNEIMEWLKSDTLLQLNCGIIRPASRADSKIRSRSQLYTCSLNSKNMPLYNNALSHSLKGLHGPNI